MKPTIWILASFWLVAASPSLAAVCVEDVCIDLAHSGGGVFASLASDGSTKAPSGSVAVNHDSEIDPAVLVSAFNDGGFNCSGSLSPSSETSRSHGEFTSSHLGCIFQLASGDVWQVNIATAWFFNATIGKWVVGDIQADSKQVKSPFRNKVE